MIKSQTRENTSYKSEHVAVEKEDSKNAQEANRETKAEEIKLAKAETDAQAKQTEAQKKFEQTSAKLSKQIEILEKRAKVTKREVFPPGVIENAKEEIHKITNESTGKMTTFAEAYEQMQRLEKKLEAKAQEQDEKETQAEQVSATEALKEAGVIAEIVLEQERLDPENRSKSDALAATINEALQTKSTERLQSLQVKGGAIDRIDASLLKGSDPKVREGLVNVFKYNPDLGTAVYIATQTDMAFEQLPGHIRSKIIELLINGKEISKDTRARLAVKYHLTERVSKPTTIKTTETPKDASRQVDNLLNGNGKEGREHTKGTTPKELANTAETVLSAFNEQMNSDARADVRFRTKIAAQEVRRRMNLARKDEPLLTEAEIRNIYQQMNLADKSKQNHRNYREARASMEAQIRQIRKTQEIKATEANAVKEKIDKAGPQNLSEEMAKKQYRLEQVKIYYEKKGAFEALAKATNKDIEAIRQEYQETINKLADNELVITERLPNGTSVIDISRITSSIGLFSELAFVISDKGEFVSTGIKNMTDEQLLDTNNDLAQKMPEAVTLGSEVIIYNSLSLEHRTKEDSDSLTDTAIRAEVITEEKLHSEKYILEDTLTQETKDRAALMVADIAIPNQHELTNKEQEEIKDASISIFSTGDELTATQKDNIYIHSLIRIREDINKLNDPNNKLTIQDIVSQRHDFTSDESREDYIKQLRNAYRINQATERMVEDIKQSFNLDGATDMNENATQIIAMNKDRPATLRGSGIKLVNNRIAEPHQDRNESGEAKELTPAQRLENALIENQRITLVQNRFLNRLQELNNKEFNGEDSLEIKRALAMFFEDKKDTDMTFRTLTNFIVYAYSLGLEVGIPEANINIDQINQKSKEFLELSINRLGETKSPEGETGNGLNVLLNDERNLNKIRHLLRINGNEQEAIDRLEGLKPNELERLLVVLFSEDLQPTEEELGPDLFKEGAEGFDNRYSQPFSVRQFGGLVKKESASRPMAFAGEFGGGRGLIASAVAYVASDLFGMHQLDMEERGFFKSIERKKVEAPFGSPRIKEWLASVGWKDETMQEWIDRIGIGPYIEPGQSDVDTIALKTFQEILTEVGNYEKKEILLLMESMGRLAFHSQQEMNANKRNLEVTDPTRKRSHDISLELAFKEAGYDVSKDPTTNQYKDKYVRRVMALNSSIQEVYDGSTWITIDADDKDPDKRRDISYGMMTKSKLDLIKSTVVAADTEADRKSVETRNEMFDKIGKAMMAEQERLFAHHKATNEALQQCTVRTLEDIVSKKERTERPGSFKSTDELAKDHKIRHMMIGGVEFNIKDVRAFIFAHQQAETKRVVMTGRIGESDFFTYKKSGYTDADEVRNLLGDPKLSDAKANKYLDKANELLGITDPANELKDKIYEIVDPSKYYTYGNQMEMNHLKEVVRGRNELNYQFIDLVKQYLEQQEFVDKAKTAKIADEAKRKNLETQITNDQSTFKKKETDLQTAEVDLATKEAAYNQNLQEKTQERDKKQTKLDELNRLDSASNGFSSSREKLAELKKIKHMLEENPSISLADITSPEDKALFLKYYSEISTSGTAEINLDKAKKDIDLDENAAATEYQNSTSNLTDTRRELKLEDEKDYNNALADLNNNKIIIEADISKLNTELKSLTDPNALTTVAYPALIDIKAARDQIHKLKNDLKVLGDRIQINLSNHNQLNVEINNKSTYLTQQERYLKDFENQMLQRRDGILKIEDKYFNHNNSIQEVTPDQDTELLKDYKTTTDFKNGEFIRLFSHRGKIQKESEDDPNRVSFMKGIKPADQETVEQMFGETHEINVGGETIEVFKDNQGAYTNMMEDRFESRKQALTLWTQFLIRDAQTNAYYDRANRFAAFWRGMENMNTVLKIGLIIAAIAAFSTLGLQAFVAAQITPYLLGSLGGSSIILAPLFAHQKNYWSKRKFAASDAVDKLLNMEGRIEQILKDPTYDYGRGLDQFNSALQKIQKAVLKADISGVSHMDVAADQDRISRGVGWGLDKVGRVVGQYS